MNADTPGRPIPVLAVMAHPDDRELWAGGTLALHARDAAVTLAVPRHEPARMTEAEAGAAILGARLHALPSPVSAADVHELITRTRPEVVIAHPLADVHPDHRQIAATVLAALPEAVISTGHPQRVYTTDTYNSLTLDGPLHAAVIVDITATYEVKAQALAAHSGTQPIAGHFRPMAETLARLWGARIGVPYAEAFTAIPVLGRLPATARLLSAQAASRADGAARSQEEPAMPVPVPVYQYSTLTAAEQVRLASQVISGDQAGAMGTGHVAELERAVAARIGRTAAIAVDSGSAALVLAVCGLGIGPGHEVIIPEVGWVSVGAAAAGTGAAVRVAPVTETLTPGWEQIKPLITPATAAVILAHLRGRAAPGTARIAAELSGRGIALIEDCAQAWGVIADGRPAGTWGTAAAFSTQAHKVISTGEGGLLLADAVPFSVSSARWPETPASAHRRRCGVACTA